MFPDTKKLQYGELSGWRLKARSSAAVFHLQEMLFYLAVIAILCPETRRSVEA
ncbi:hypothetical protein CFter6_4576 [Collimonas fungivorans]|uniref:Uncharacterized protein n=1 Tax=Collimonas fungivorans TaxID=158899 RepID=A0A127PH77_9BURK|nr:hypothetical protein CFter6_4576 [Collimonas fungivorans]